MAIRYNEALGRELPEFGDDFTVTPPSDGAYFRWYWYQDARVGARVENGYLVVHSLYRESRMDNDEISATPRSTGFLDDFTITAELIALEHDLKGVMVDEILNPFLPGALQRRGYTIISTPDVGAIKHASQI